MKRSIDIAAIDVQAENRLRPLDPVQVGRIADSMKRQQADGLPALISPIEVSRSGERYILTEGWHRIEAAKRLGFTTIDASIVDANRDQRLLREVEANLCRHDLNKLDWSFFLKEWFVRQGVVIATGFGGKDEKALLNQCSAILTENGFSEAASERIGISPSSIRRGLLIADRLHDVREDIAALPVACNQAELLALAKKEPTARKALIEQLKAGKTFKEATTSKAKPPKKKGGRGALQAAWGNTSAAEQNDFLVAVIAHLAEKRRGVVRRRLAEEGVWRDEASFDD